jgi:AcrR family transcriptional regulator
MLSFVPLPEIRVPADSVPGMPRRERKKQQTRDALIHAALTLCAAHGYDRTAVREITDAVDVSERTFFRYFASKEDLVLSLSRERTAALLGALATRPPDEEPLTALRQAFRQSLDFTPEAEAEYLAVLKLIDATPTLIAASLRDADEHSEEIVTALALREGVDPATDLRPRILAATFGVLVFKAIHDWRDAGETGVEAMLARLDGYVAQFGPSLFGHWRNP